jgi:hypothetical protein
MINKHYRGIKVKYLGATDFRGARIKLIDERFEQSKTINYSYLGGHTLDQAIEYLSDNGFNVIGYSEMKDEYVIFCDNWYGACIKLKDIK